jgi:hypothetical protein
VPRGKRPVAAIVRLDDAAIRADDVNVVQVRDSFSDARTEVERLTALNAGKGVRYVAHPDSFHRG